MKTRGPLFQDADGQFCTDEERPDPESYLRLLARTPDYVVNGGVDFAALIDPINRLVEH